MAQTIVGIDIGYSRLKMVLISGQKVKKTAIAKMPERLYQNGRIVSVETMGELIRETMRENGIRANKAALVVTGEDVYVRTVSLPQMTESQLTYNLPYEFRDYIKDDLKTYYFDYAMISTPADLEKVITDEETGEKQKAPMELFAAAAPKEMIEDYRMALRKAGLKLVKCAPVEHALLALLDEHETVAGKKDDAYAILDFGYQSIRMHVYEKGKHEVTRILESGVYTIIQAIADEYGVDDHLAETYLESNHEDCLEKACCTDAYERIAVELTRAVNFYRFSHPDSTLTDVWLTGGGAAIPGMRQAVESMLNLNIHKGKELFSLPEDTDTDSSGLLAAAVALS